MDANIGGFFAPCLHTNEFEKTLNLFGIFFSCSSQNRNMKIPSMGFTDNYTKKKLSSTTTNAATAATAAAAAAANEAIKRKSHANEVQSTADLLNICGDVDEDDVDANRRQSLLIPDQEILDSTEPIYFEENVDTNTYELNVRILSHLLPHYICPYLVIHCH